MKYVAAIGILTFWLVVPGRVGPLLAQQPVTSILVLPPGQASTTARPHTLQDTFKARLAAALAAHSGAALDGHTAVVVLPDGCLPERQVDCMEYDNGGKCIDSKVWAECRDLVTNETYRTFLEYGPKGISMGGEHHQQKNDAPDGASH